jgi:ribosomal protein L11 methyltransferase
MLELFPQGFEEIERNNRIELVAYTDAAGEEHLWQAFGGARGEDVAADWRDRWKRFHQPVAVGPFWIGPSWHQPPPDATPVVIDPGRAFGTGAHPTTQLCIELLLEQEPSSAIDLGCGSGVLAIVAAKRGFAPVLAVDADENAVAATRSNADLNGVAVDARRLDVLAGELPYAQLALANITLRALESLLPLLRCDRLISSGYLESDGPEHLPFRHGKRVTRDGWAADLYERPDGSGSNP